MRFLLFMLALCMLGGCGKEQEKTKAETLKTQADIAKSKLQEKADALAKAASASPGNSNTAKPHKP